jgi:hypothetical protein
MKAFKAMIYETPFIQKLIIIKIIQSQPSDMINGFKRKHRLLITRHYLIRVTDESID